MGMFTAISFVISPKWIQSKFPLASEWINTFLHSYTLCIKRKQTPGTSKNTDESKKYYTRGKISETKVCLLYDSIYIKF